MQNEVTSDEYGILVIGPEIGTISEIERAARSLEYPVELVQTPKDAVERMCNAEFGIIILDISIVDQDAFESCRDLRRSFSQRPLQILLLAESEDREFLERALEIGIDDYLRKPAAELDLQMRIKAAGIRLRQQMGLYQEREFYRQAVKQEELLSSKILDQNLLLKKAFQNIEVVKRDLERSNQILKKIAKYDNLSGLMNRLSLFTSLEIEIERTAASGIPLSAIMIDIDRFKMINDNYGHQCGDEVIRSIGICLRERLRKYDIAGRYGGEEFLVLLPNTDLDTAVKIAERFRQDFEKMTVHCGTEGIPIRASIGVAQYEQGEHKEKWISRADRAMYDAKQQGRNRVVSR